MDESDTDSIDFTEYNRDCTGSGAVPFAPAAFCADPVPDLRQEKEDIYAKARVSWLLHFLHVSVLYENGEARITVRILGFPVVKIKWPEAEKEPEPSADKKKTESENEREGVKRPEGTQQPEAGQETAEAEKEKTPEVIALERQPSGEKTESKPVSVKPENAEKPRPENAEKPKPESAKKPKQESAERPKPESAEKSKPESAEKPRPEKKEKANTENKKKKKEKSRKPEEKAKKRNIEDTVELLKQFWQENKTAFQTIFKKIRAF